MAGVESSESFCKFLLMRGEFDIAGSLMIFQEWAVIDCVARTTRTCLKEECLCSAPYLLHHLYICSLVYVLTCAAVTSIIVLVLRSREHCSVIGYADAEASGSSGRASSRGSFELNHASAPNKTTFVERHPLVPGMRSDGCTSKTDLLQRRCIPQIRGLEQDQAKDHPAL